MTPAGPELQPVACLVCERTGPDRLLHVKDGYRIVRCERCGFVFVNPRPSLEAAQHVYEEYYFAAGGLEGGYADYLGQAKFLRRTFEGRLRRARRHRSGGRLLDIGCGPGLALDAAANLGFEPWGIDLSRYAVSLARERHGDKVLCGELEHGRFPAGFFDLVSMFDVFEHLYEPRKLLDVVKEVLAPEGLLVITTPNHDSLLSRLSGPRWVSFKLPEHVAYYTPETLMAVVGDRFELLGISSAGQYCSLEFLVERVRQLSAPLGGVLGALVRATRSTERGIYVNNGSMTAMLRKPADPS